MGTTHNTTRSNPGSESTSFMERLVFGNRPLFIIVFFLITAVLFYQMIKLRPEASFEDMIPRKHPYIKNYNNTNNP